MTTDITLKCACGKVSGRVKKVKPSVGNHAVCYCNDCQAFARFLGNAPQVLDANGGTDIFQTTPGRVVFSQGIEHLACIRLSPKGILRWYASCCSTPICNTGATPGLPFVGLIHSGLGDGVDGTPRAEIIGPVRTQAFTQFATGDTDGLKTRGLLKMATRLIRMMIGARLRGEHKRSSFFKPGSMEPIALPKTLNDTERAAVYPV
ncbi:MAG: DUF6151 family protein [Paracoccaceae bacterium]